MKTNQVKMEKILDGLVINYDAAEVEQDKANALVLIQTQLNNMILLNEFELGKLNIEKIKN